MTALRRLCGTLWDITHDNPQNGFVEHYGALLMTALTRLRGTLWDITYDSNRKVLWNTMGHNL
jgi:hypothetical protein